MNSEGKITFGKYVNQHYTSMSKDYQQWAEDNIEGFEKALRKCNPIPCDNGSDVSDDRGSIIGTRGYTKFNSDEWVPRTLYSDGSSVVHCGGPCGDLYVDEFGNT